MGVVWQLLDLKNERRFGLDKGGWYALADIDVAMSVDSMVKACREARPNDESDHRDLAERLWAFCEVACWDVMTMNDHADYHDDAMMSWPIMDERCKVAGDVMDADPCEAETVAALTRAQHATAMGRYNALMESIIDARAKAASAGNVYDATSSAMATQWLLTGVALVSLNGEPR